MKILVYRAAAGVAAVIAVCAITGVATGIASVAKNGPPLINIEGSSYTNNRVVNGLTRQTRFSLAAKEARDGTVSGTFAYQLYNVAPDGTSTEIASTDADVACLSADKTTGTVWFSALVSSVSDQRLPSELQAQMQQIRSDANLIVIGRFADTNADGSADTRSVFVTDAITAYPNALLSSGDDGMVFGPWFIDGMGTSAANACLLHDNAYTGASYRVIDGPTNQVQWLEPDAVTTIGSPFTGTATNLSNPPAQSISSVAGFTLQLLSATLDLTIR
jgi:hypothetical protein